MVFSSVPLYLDPPNWQQHNPNQHQLQGNENHQHHLIIPPHHPMPQPPPQVVMGGPGSGPPPIRPNSMAERARMAKIPPPEAPLKCPRCESINTKFCYFNNYSLTQPRHFCKTCRRYWTRGGALRNVPVGGGCRRNKRSSGKSSSSSGGGGGGGGSGSTGVISSSSSKSPLSSPTGVGGDRHMDIVGPPTIPGMIPSAVAGGGGGGGGGMSSFMTSLHNIAQIGMGNLGLNFGGGSGSFHAPPPPHHVLGGGIGGDHHHHHHHNHNHHNQLHDFNPSINLLSSHNNAPSHNAQVHFPNFLGGGGGGFEMLPGGALYSNSFDQGVVDDDHDHHNQMNDDVNVDKSSSSMMAPVKMEEGQRLNNLAKQFMMGINSSSSSDNININVTGNNQFWGGNTGGGGGGLSMWTGLSGLNSSSSSHFL